MEDVTLPNGLTIKAEDMALAGAWVNITADLMHYGTWVGEKLKLAVNAVAEAANSRYENLDGGFVSFDLEDLDGHLDHWDEEVQEAWLDCTTDLMMAAQDGPIATAVHLRTAIDSIIEKGGKV